MNDGSSRKTIALVAHDNKKEDLAGWARFNKGLLARHHLVATATTAVLLERELEMPVGKLLSGPLGGDQQIGSMISEGKIDLLIFFWDPLEPHPHDPDVKALLRIAVVWNIPIACNRATADFVISSPLMAGDYERVLPDYVYGEAPDPAAPAPAVPSRRVLTVLTGATPPDVPDPADPKARAAG